MTPATLTPGDTDADIFNTIAAQPWARVQDIDGTPVAIWSRTQDAWLGVAEYAAEWRHEYRYGAVMGDEETTRAVTRYEKGLGL